jgi:nitroreductase
VEKPAETTNPVHDLIKRRWSPRSFADKAVESAVLRSLLEAARWAPSSNNEQPWFYIVATKEEPAEFERLLNCLVESNQTWARHAPVLMLSVARLVFNKNGQLNRHALHDVGQAAAHLALEATARGLGVHQMAGILPEKARELFAIPAGFEVVAGMAVGYPGDPEALPEKLKEREVAPRFRKPLVSFVFAGKWGQTAPVVK